MWNSRNSPGDSAGMRGMFSRYQLSLLTAKLGHAAGGRGQPGTAVSPRCQHSPPDPFILLLLLLGSTPSAVPAHGVQVSPSGTCRDIAGGQHGDILGVPQQSRAEGSEDIVLWKAGAECQGINQ